MSTAGPARVLDELLALERETTELEYVRRADALEGVRDAVRRLGEVGISTRIVQRAAHELGTSGRFDRVLISEVAGGFLEPQALWTSGAGDEVDVLAELSRIPIRLEYPSIEEEVARRRRAEIVRTAAAGARGGRRLVEVLGWHSYLVCALAVHGTTIGMIHADSAASGRSLDGVDVEVTERFADGLAGALERAVLRDTLRSHREELQAAVQWMSSRLSGLAHAPAPGSQADASLSPGVLAELTARELDVLRLMARGQTNAVIAGGLVIREGTVKYHVKNILRKLGAANRADAVSRYLRAAGPEDER
jgi:LuxR family transcriptional regulator, regulator of acetate metabolism